MQEYSKFGLTAAASKFPIYYTMRLKTVLLLRKQTNRKLYANIRGIVIFLFYPLRYIYIYLCLLLTFVSVDTIAIWSHLFQFSLHIRLCPNTNQS